MIRLHARLRPQYSRQKRKAKYPSTRRAVAQLARHDVDRPARAGRARGLGAGARRACRARPRAFLRGVRRRRFAQPSREIQFPRDSARASLVRLARASPPAARGAGGRGERDVRRPGVRPGEVQLARGRPERHPVRAPAGRVPRGETPRASPEPLLHEIIVSGHHRRPHAPLPQPHVRQRGRPRAAQVHGFRVRRVSGSDVATGHHRAPRPPIADPSSLFAPPAKKVLRREKALFSHPPSALASRAFANAARAKTSGTRR